MTYLDRPAPAKGPPWAHNSLGASIHNALANWWRLPRGERTVPAAGALLERGWIGEGFADDTQSERHRRRAKVIVESYVAGLDPDAEPVGIERTVAMKTELIAISGRIDRLDDRQPGHDASEVPAQAGQDDRRAAGRDVPGESGTGQARTAGASQAIGADRQLVVVDYKTGRQPLTVDDVRSSMTLALYALAAGRVLRRPCQKVELHHLPTGQVLAWNHSSESLDRQLGRAEQIAIECAQADERFRAEPDTARGDETFPPQPGAWCGWCDYRAHCQEGRQAAPARRPWDGLISDGS